jgi:hypothetical protein
MTITLNLRPLRALRAGLSVGSGNPVLAGAFRQWGRIYLAFATKRFSDKETVGWRALRPSTVKQRIRQGFPGPQPILRRIGEVKRALREGEPGNQLRMIAKGVRTGYGGNSPHSRYPGQKRSSPSIAQIAEWHNTGTARMPKRQIIVPPNRPTLQSMIHPLGVAIRRIIAGG